MMLKKQTTFFILTINYYHNLKEKLENFTFSTSTNNFYYDFKKELKIQLVFLALILFINNSNISNIIFFNIKLTKINNVL